MKTTIGLLTTFVSFYRFIRVILHELEKEKVEFVHTNNNTLFTLSSSEDFSRYYSF